MHYQGSVLNQYDGKGHGDYWELVCATALVYCAATETLGHSGLFFKKRFSVFVRGATPSEYETRPTLGPCRLYATLDAQFHDCTVHPALSWFPPVPSCGPHYPSSQPPLQGEKTLNSG